MKFKAHLKRILREFYLIKLMDFIFYFINVQKNRKSNKNFCRKHPDFIVPPYYLAYDAYHHTNWENYLESGIIHAELISNIIKKTINNKEINIFEWGCGPVRVLRHLEKIDDFNSVQLMGSDYNSSTINWCKKNFHDIQFIMNELHPPLHIESNCLDCIIALSVFTHLSEELHYEWIDELYRILKPNGILIFTTHGNLSSNRLINSELKRYENGEIIVSGKVKEGKKHFLTYHPHHFITNKLLKNFSVVEHISDTRAHYMEQELWVARKENIINVI